MPSALAALLLLSAITASAQTTQGSSVPQLDGKITGIVTNNEGDTIAGARLCTEVTRGNGSSTSCGEAQSDEHGQFELHVPLGQIGVFAEKQQGGYWGLIDPGPSRRKGIHTVTLTAEAPTARVTLKIGPRPGELTFDVKDKSTGKPVEGFSVRWIGIDDTRMMSIQLPVVRALIPPDIEAILEVHANGYRRWFYIDPSNPSQPILRLASGEEKHLDVELEPEEKK